MQHIIFAGPLVDIFNLSLRTGIFPDDWKLAKVTPIFKDGNRNKETSVEITDQFR